MASRPTIMSRGRCPITLTNRKASNDQLLTNIELYGRQVIPRVRELLS
jgi:hypothetical protein